MPIYIDRHDAPHLTPDELAGAHIGDVEVQHRHGVRYHTYWFDPINGSVSCLVEGPTRNAVEAVHQEAHGQLAATILEVDPTVPLNAILSAFPMHPPEAPAIRAILFTDLCGSVEQTSNLGDLRHLDLVRAHDRVMRRQITRNCGREVKHTGDGIMAAFASAGCAVTCAITAQQAFHEHNDTNAVPLEVKIGISAGEPVTDGRGDVFGASVQLAARLCGSASAGRSRCRGTLAVRSNGLSVDDRH